MKNSSGSLAALLSVLTSLSTVASASVPIDFFEVVEVTPSATRCVVNTPIESLSRTRRFCYP
jgi:hypothetical protein